MRLIFLLLALLPFIQSTRNVTCTNDFTLRKFAGNLVTIRNPEENSALATFVGYQTKRVWIGLYCFGSEWKDCFPTVDIYKCVFYKVTGSRESFWLSGDCSQDLRSFVCEIPTTFKDNCSLNYNGSCYFPIEVIKQGIGKDLTQVMCQADCADLVSIHSANENRFIQNIYQNRDSIDSILLGAVTQAGKQSIWMDDTNWDFSNVDHNHYTYGTCLKMYLQNNGSRSKGSWYITPCEEYHYFMCKRPAGMSCSEISRTKSFPEASKTISGCGGSLMMSGSFSSPNYPEMYPNFQNCSYSLSTLAGQRIRITFQSIAIEARYDNITIFDGEQEERPSAAVTLTGNYTEPYYYESLSNVVNVIFTSDISNTDYGFTAKFVTIS
ncbi:hypothetical protein GCK72_004425 [Caenorhabditis remanei]|uniref:CUB domain-containing protein n=1 Tax=Caenorhabditis remanei TaxID=31234 RepID=A0A6A5HBD5_CAERE|nr:hypothetical protein GCK72_004425 [Caenorhabditis remanei]KAF1764477.1 hypothetical protein GCK72_004425 [Caenorhabditis remanei]